MFPAQAASLGNQEASPSLVYGARLLSGFGVHPPSCVRIALPPLCAASSTDRAPDYGSGGWGFESLAARQTPQVRGLELLALRHPRCCTGLGRTLPRLGRRLGALPRRPRGRVRTWDDVRVLRVQVDRLQRWFRPGLLCDIEIQSLGGDTVTSATAASKDWLAANARIVRGKTVLKSGGKEHTLARTDLSRLIRDASSP